MKGQLAQKWQRLVDAENTDVVVLKVVSDQFQALAVNAVVSQPPYPDEIVDVDPVVDVDEQENAEEHGVVVFSARLISQVRLWLDTRAFGRSRSCLGIA